MTRPVAPTTRWWRSVLVLIALATFACDQPTEPDYVPLAERELAVNPTGVALSGVGATASFALVDSTGAFVPADSVTWFSLAPGLATIDAASGVVTAVAAGQVIIGARIDTVQVAYAVVTVSVPGDPLRSWVADTLSRPQLISVWGRSDSDIYAAGRGRFVYHFDGQEWRSLDTGGSQHLWDLVGLDSGTVFAVGPSTLLRYDGDEWTRSPTPYEPRIMAFWPTSATGGFAGDELGGIWRYNDSTWAREPAGVGGPQPAVWGRGPGDVYAGGSNKTVIHYDGATWTALGSDLDHGISHLWGTPTGDLFAGGAGGISRYDGSAWSPIGDQSVKALGGSSATDVWTLGTYGPAHYDGTDWADSIWYQLVPEVRYLDANVIVDFWVSPSGSVFGVGSDGALVTRIDGTWRFRRIGAGTQEVTGLWAAGPGNVLMVGASSAILAIQGGDTWKELCPATSGNRLSDIWAAAPDNVFAVGPDEGMLSLYHDGYCQTKSLIGQGDGTLTGIWGSAPDDVWVVGFPFTWKTGVIMLHFNGTSWRRTFTALSVTASLYDIWGSASDDVWTVGALDGHGGIWHNYGTGWVGAQVPEGDTLKAVWGTSREDVFAVGLSGRILHYDGISWSEMQSGTDADLYAVWGTAHTDVFAAGDLTVLHFDGHAWAPVDGAHPAYYRAIAGSSIGPVYFGAEGQIIEASR